MPKLKIRKKQIGTPNHGVNPTLTLRLEEYSLIGNPQKPKIRTKRGSPNDGAVVTMADRRRKEGKNTDRKK